ncbi:sporulation histidine kinase inhibitor Sda [Oceanobacillus sp. CAU 1775]
MQNLSDELLLESYNTARKLNLNEDFLSLMKKEIEKRRLVKEKSTSC